MSTLRQKQTKVAKNYSGPKLWKKQQPKLTKLHGGKWVGVEEGSSM